MFFSRLPGESLKSSPPLARWLWGHVKGFDIVHVHSVFSFSSLAAAGASRYEGVPYVVRPLGQLDAWSLAQHAYRKRLFLAAGGRRLVEGAAALHWTDESERNAVPRFGWVCRGFVSPLGVDDALFEEMPGLRRKKTVLFLSRLHPKKNLEGLLEAFCECGAAAVGWTLVIAGDGEEEYVATLRKRAEGVRGAGRVELVGWLGGEAKREALREAGLVALPSKQENFGIAVAEAMAAGTPVLVSEAVALADEIRAAGAGWVARGGESGLAEALRQALASDDDRRQRGAAARRLASERFRWSAVAAGLVRTYEALARPERKPS